MIPIISKNVIDTYFNKKKGDPMTNQEIENEIQAENLNAPRITPEQVESVISKCDYHHLTPLLTICVLTLQNGFVVTGESACASPENYDEEIGRKIAREEAKNKIWLLEGYLLKQKLYEQEICKGAGGMLFIEDPREKSKT